MTMAMVDVDGSSHLLADSQPKSVGLVLRLALGGHPALSLHSSNEPGELFAVTMVMRTAP